MALPQVNEVPSYFLTIPSTKKEIKFRPFLVKEQKILLIALETRNQKDILNAITSTINSCMLDEINVDKLSTFDVEYMFTQIRSKSVGETSTILVKCDGCEVENEVTINLEHIEVIPDDTVSDMVKLNDTYTLKLRYPKYEHMLDESFRDTETPVSKTIYHFTLGCLDSLMTEEENIVFDDEPREEVEKFLESLTNEQFENIMKFVNAIPRLEKKVEFNCIGCEKTNEYVLQGIEDFF